ncbi:hypothetical protein JA1_004211 [Spathaspora sp. JA1]|nr:hypothetical protein JA1_004211 [Spathaspora sp. JA1]
MATIHSLPDELLSLIFQNLSWVEISNTIKTLHQVPEYSRIIVLLYQHLFKERFMVIREGKQDDFSNPSAAVSFDEMFRHSKDQISLFQQIQPKFVQLEFVKEGDDGQALVNHLTRFRDIFKCKQSANQNIFQNVSILKFFVYSSPAYSIAYSEDILDTLMDVIDELSSNLFTASKMEKMIISSLNFGSRYESHLSKYLCKFDSLS